MGQGQASKAAGLSTGAQSTETLDSLLDSNSHRTASERAFTRRRGHKPGPSLLRMAGGGGGICRPSSLPPTPPASETQRLRTEGITAAPPPSGPSIPLGTWHTAVSKRERICPKVTEVGAWLRSGSRSSSHPAPAALHSHPQMRESVTRVALVSKSSSDPGHLSRSLHGQSWLCVLSPGGHPQREHWPGLRSTESRGIWRHPTHPETLKSD